MDNIANNPPGERLVRDQCRVGDWVDAVHVPEWRDAMTEQTFRPDSSIVISPQLDQYGGVAPAAHPNEWKFVRYRVNDKAAWLRSA